MRLTDKDPYWPPAPGKPELADDEIHVWRIELDDSPRTPEALESLLTEDELRRAAAFRFERDRRRFATGRAALRRILGGYASISPAVLRFCYGEHGKPELAPPADASGLRFNLSHSGGLALCGMTRRREIGVDVERIRARTEVERFARRFFSAAEASALLSLPAEQWREAFFRCWTRKEAYLKAVGSGVFGGLTRFDVTLAPGEPARLLRVEGDPDEAERWTMHDLAPGKGFAGAVIARGSALRVQLLR